MAIQLSPDDLARLRDKQLANAIRKLGEGKSLTAREDALLAQAGVGSTAAAPSGFCKTWDQLAERLGVSLRALKDWRNREDLREHLPKDRADGRHEVAAWARFMVEHGLARADETAPLAGCDEIHGGAADESAQPKTIRDWKARLEELKCQRLEQKIRVESGELTITADVEIALGQLLIAFRASLDHLAPSAARWVRGLTDFHAIVERLQAECDGVLHGLYRGDYLGEILPGIVAALPPPDGIAPQPWTAALTAATTNVLRAIGRLALPSESLSATTEPNATENQTTRELTTRQSPAACETTANVATPAVKAVAAKSPRKRATPKRARKPRTARTDAEASAHAQLKPTLAERTRQARERRKR